LSDYQIRDVFGYTDTGADTTSATADPYDDFRNPILAINGTTGFTVTTAGNVGYKPVDTTSVTSTAIHEWVNLSSAEMVFGKVWMHSRCRISSASATAITMAAPAFEYCLTSGLGIYAHMAMTDRGQLPDEFYVENALELLDTPGEWYLTPGPSRILYLKPCAGMNLSTGVPIIAPVLETLVSGNGASNITFDGLQFSYATWLTPNSAAGFPDYQGTFRTNHPSNPNHTQLKTPGAVTFIACMNLEIKNCIFSHLGSTALDFNKGCKYILVEGNAFYDISGVAVQMGEISQWDPSTSDEVSYNQIRNNYITDIGVEYQGAPGIMIGFISDSIIANNEIYDVPYSGISIGWGWMLHGHNSSTHTNNQISNNWITKHMQKRPDGGGIYTLSSQGTAISNGLQITGNFIYGQGSTGNGIYFDQGSDCMTVSGNVIFNNQLWDGSSADYGGNNVKDLNFTGNYYQNTNRETSFHDTTLGRDLTAGERATANITLSGNTAVTNLLSSPVTSILSAAGLGAFSGIKSKVVYETRLEGRLVNLSALATVDSTKQVVVGFTISGTSSKSILVRGIGPELATFSVDGIDDPVLTLYSGSTQIHQNNDWGSNSNASTIVSTSSAVGAFALPSGSKDAALLVSVSPGGYTAVLSNAGSVSGSGLVEIYETDVSSNPGTKPTNMSARVFTQSNQTVTQGFTVGGATPKRVVIRAIGPTLASFGISDPLPDPEMALNYGLHNLATNDSWVGGFNLNRYTYMDKQAQDHGAFPITNWREAGIMAELQPGGYTATVSNHEGGQDGVAILEIYIVEP